MKNVYVKILALSIACLSLFFVFSQVNNGGLTKSNPVSEINISLTGGVESFKGGNYQDAAGQFQEYPEDGPLADYVSYLIAKTYYRLGRFTDSISVLSNLGVGSSSVVLPVEKYLLLAKNYLQQGKTSEAREVTARAYENAATKITRVKVLELQLEIFEDLNRFAKAFETGIKLANNLELRYIGDRRDKLFAKLSRLRESIDPNSSPNPAALFEYTELLSLYGQYLRSRSVLIQYLDQWTKKYRSEVYFDIGWLSGFRLDRPTEALVTFNRLTREQHSPAFTAKVKYYKALINKRLSDNFDLTGRLIEISKQYPNTYFGKHAISKAVSKLIDDTSLVESEKIVDRYRYLLTETSFRDLTWQLFFHAYSRKAFSACRSYLMTLESYHGEGDPIIEYYRYKLGLATDGKFGSQNSLKVINFVEENPFNYYSLLAVDNGWTGSTFTFSDIWSESELDPKEYENSLIQRDFSDQTEEMLKTAIRLKNHDLIEPALTRLYRLGEDVGEKDFLMLKFFWEREAENYRKSIKAAAGLLRAVYGRNNPPPVTIVKGSYPCYYRELVEKHAAEFGIPPAVIYGLVRQESVFNPQAYSVSGARGLTQIMPRTARAIAEDLNMNGFSLQKLYQVDTSLRMGTYYIANKITGEGDVRLGLMAYHGGSGNLRDWKDAYSTTDVDIFHEKIPRASTSNYVSGVYRNYSIYEKLLKYENS